MRQFIISGNVWQCNCVNPVALTHVFCLKKPPAEAGQRLRQSADETEEERKEWNPMQLSVSEKRISGN